VPGKKRQEQMITAPQLFAGIENPAGNENCFYCGGVCGEEHSTKKYVKDTFTNRDIVRRPSSQFICGGCVACFEDRDIVLINGEKRKDQWTRLYSWIFTGKKQIAATKAHLKEITETILNPPEPPFGIVLVKSGQKQLLFRSVIAWSRNNYPVMLEDEIITISRQALQDKMHIAKIVIAAIGKPSLSEMESNHAIRYFDYYGNLESFELWKKEMHNPINRLALYLSPNQKECQNEHPRIGRANARAVQAQVSMLE
jgi:CRISPR type IV-associated protein Csf1